MSEAFTDLIIDDSSFLDDIDERITCEKCKHSRKYYCYSCFCPVGGIDDKLPRVQLPLKVDIIKHPNEIDGKSTAAHAAILAPEHVTVHTYPCIPQYKDKSKVLLIFPGECSLTLNELRSKTVISHDRENSKNIEDSPESENSDICEGKPETTPHSASHEHRGTSVSNKRSVDDEDSCDANKNGPQSKKQKTDMAASSPCSYDTVVFIDSTWAQTRKISKDERLQGLMRVELKSQVTKFWRHQKDKPDTYLATIEAIYYFFTEYHSTFLHTDYTGQYDNLLFFFKYLHKKLWNLYGGEKQRKKIQQKDNKKTRNDNT